jgi:hypothetical protein
VELEHEADGGAAQRGERRVVERLGRLPGSSKPMMLSSVLLPEPEGPLSATNSASCNARVMPCNTSVSTGVPML